ncbi:unnamed protein product [Brassica oleracea]
MIDVKTPPVNVMIPTSDGDFEEIVSKLKSMDTLSCWLITITAMQRGTCLRKCLSTLQTRAGVGGMDNNN